MKTLRTLVLVAAALVLMITGAAAQYQPSGGTDLSRVAGRFVANQYNYSGTQDYVLAGNSSTGAASVTLQVAKIVLNDGRVIFPFNVTSPIAVGTGSTMELVTPTAVSNCVSFSSQIGSCTITATFANTHGFGEPVVSASGGLAEAIYDAFLTGGGMVTVDNQWASGVLTGCTACYTSANNAINSVVPYSQVSIEDLRFSAPQYWNLVPGTTTTLAAPTTLTAVTALPSATPVGAYGTGTYFMCVAYVDIMGNEGQCSATFSQAGLATGSFIFTAPAASTGAVGYTIYISLTSGTYALSYKVPLTSSICTLTKLENAIAACAVANATYGQSAATATVTAITVNTARIWVGLGGTSTTADYVGNSASRTVYAYAPSSHIATTGVVASYSAFAGATAPATTVPAVLGTIQLPAGFMNYVGREIRVCGFAKEASAGSTSTITTIQFLWNADGSNTAGAGVILGGPTVTATLVTSNADQWSFCQNLRTTVAGASVTAGSIIAGAGFLTESYGAATTVSAATGPTIGAAAVGSLNLAGEARIDVVYLHTTGTDGATPILQDLTVEVVN